jgi:hypothetical protein
MTVIRDLDTFRQTYLGHDFDGTLYAQDNAVVNDMELYLKHKCTYLEQTQRNVSTLQDLYQQLQNTERTDVVIFGIEEEQASIKRKIRKVLLSQQGLYENFLNHIRFLNSNKELFR